MEEALLGQLDPLAQADLNDDSTQDADSDVMGDVISQLGGSSRSDELSRIAISIPGIFDNNVTQETLSVADIEYEEAALEDPQNTYWLVIAKEIYLLRSYLDTDTASPKMEGHRLCDIHYVNGPLIGHCTKSILVHVGNEAPWRIVTTNEEEYLHWFQILNAVAFESNFLES